MGKDSIGRPAADSWLRRRPIAVDLTLAGVLAALALPTSLRLVWISDLQLPGQLAISAILVLAHVAVALRRILMRSAFVLVALTVLVLALAPALGGAAAAQVGSEFAPILLPSSITFPVMLYAVAAYGRDHEPLLALGVAAVGAVLVTQRLWDPGNWTTGVPTGNGWRLFILVAMLATVIAPWALGRFRGVHEAYVGALEQQARRADQDRRDEAERATASERSRIAREMHDVVAHSLSVMVSQAEGGRLAAQRDPAIAPPVLGTIAATGREALTEMRGLLGVLGGGQDGAPVARTPQPALSDLDGLVNRVRAAGTQVLLTEQGLRGDLGRAGELAAYRVAQEALTNVVKHAGAGARASVELQWTPDGLRIEITDDGRVMVPAGTAGRGLTGMRERVDLLGGDLDVGPNGDVGYRVRARVPLVDKATEDKATHDKATHEKATQDKATEWSGR